MKKSNLVESRFLIKFQGMDKCRKVFSDGHLIKETNSIDCGYSIFDKVEKKYLFLDDLSLWKEGDIEGFKYDYKREAEDDIDSYIENVRQYLEEDSNISKHQIIVRRKVEVKSLIHRNIILTKYEFKLKYKFNDEECCISYGGTGKLDELHKRHNYLNIINDYNEYFKFPIVNLKFKGYLTILMGNQLVGFLCHEAIGHMAEADLVDRGSAFKNKLGNKILDSKVSVIDNGTLYMNGAGSIVVDDEGNEARTNLIIDKGVLNTYLTDETWAKYYGLNNTNNSRSANWDQPNHIRMTNTYLLGGDKTVEEILRQIEWGLYIKDTVLSGNCLLNGNFEIFVKRAFIIEKGEIVGRVEKIRIKENVFHLFNNIYNIGNDVRLCLGASSCGKYSSIKVDAGGPHILCECYVEVL